MDQSSRCIITDSMSQEVKLISDLYRTKLGQAANFRRMAVQQVDCTDLTRSHFRDRAFALESQATYVAHCLALFGDCLIASMDFERHFAEVKQMTCEERNPWSRGLAIIREEAGLAKP